MVTDEEIYNAGMKVFNEFDIESAYVKCISYQKYWRLKDMDILKKFLQAEINSKAMYLDICEFVNSFHIRSGEFEGNEYVIKKMDQDNYIIFAEYEDKEGKREIPFSMSIYKMKLLEEMKNCAMQRKLI